MKKDPTTSQYNVTLTTEGGNEQCALISNSLYSLFSSATVTMGENQVGLRLLDILYHIN